MGCQGCNYTATRCHVCSNNVVYTMVKPLKTLVTDQVDTTKNDFFNHSYFIALEPNQIADQLINNYFPGSNNLLQERNNVVANVIENHDTPNIPMLTNRRFVSQGCNYTADTPLGC